MTALAIIGGTGLTALKSLAITRREMVHTPFGEPSGPLTFGELSGKEVVFLPRHGSAHTIPPHKINYRANIWALHHAGVRRVVAVAAVGGISAALDGGDIVVPDQVVDYTWGRDSTFFEEGLSQVTHIDFTDPYSETLRQALLDAGSQAGVPLVAGGIYGCTQGPRLETAAEINRMERDGCTLVGMTGMPEAALARELELDYACCAVVVNKAAGRGKGPITMEEIEHTLDSAMEKVRRLLEQFLARGAHQGAGY
ncbi:MAG TPA: S-methyl-5'-thioinosine phosphorylase [Gammaproteobacteria bacterium]|nr:S-methyl-5'-thioinosine phosphorylase [Gammaproteobacteria bacterium]